MIIFFGLAILCWSQHLTASVPPPQQELILSFAFSTKTSDTPETNPLKTIMKSNPFVLMKCITNPQSKEFVHNSSHDVANPLKSKLSYFVVNVSGHEKEFLTFVGKPNFSLPIYLLFYNGRPIEALKFPGTIESTEVMKALEKIIPKLRVM